MKHRSPKRDIIPAFSADIEQQYPQSFFRIGFGAVKALLKMFLTFFAFIGLLLVLFATVFSLNLKVEGMGIIEPYEYKQVRTEVSSVVNMVFVKNGDRVKKGDCLAVLSDFEYKIQLFQAQRDLDSAIAELKRRIEKRNLSYSVFESVEDYSEIRTKTTGLIEKILVRTGDRVKKGDCLAVLSDFEYKIQLFQAQRDLDFAIAELKRRIENYKLSHSIYKDFIRGSNNTIPFKDIPEIAMQQAIVDKVAKQVDLLKDEIEKTRVFSPVSGTVLTSKLEEKIGVRILEGEGLMVIGKVNTEIANRSNHNNKLASIPEIALQQAIVDKVTKQVDSLRYRLKKTRIPSPIDGTVITPDLEKLIGKLVSEGEILMVVGKLDKWVIKAMIKEKDIPKIRVGYKAKIKINAFPFMEFKMFNGKVINISNMPASIISPVLLSKDEEEEGNNPLLYFAVTIELDDSYIIMNNKRYDFQYGLLANINILVAKKKIAAYVWSVILGKLELFGDISI